MKLELMQDIHKTILAIGDPHFKLDNIEEVNIFITKVEELVINNKPDIIVVLGDLLHYHERVVINCLNLAYKFIHMLRSYTKTIILVGNHDMESHTQFLTENHWMNAMKYWDNVIIVDKIILIDNMVFCPYVPPGRFIEALDTLGSGLRSTLGSKDPLPQVSYWKQAPLIFCHQEFFGCKMGAIISETGDKWSLDYPQIISGHIHDKQTPQKNIYYTGSSMQHAFGENHHKSLVYIKGNELTELPLDIVRKRILNLDIKNIESFDPLKNPNDKIRINITGDFEEFKVFKKTEQYKDLIQSGVKVIYQGVKKMDIVETHSFEKILYDSVVKENNPQLSIAYNYIFHNGEKDGDILLLL